MPTTLTLSPTPTRAQLHRSSQRRPGLDPGLLIAAALFLSVLIAAGVFTVLAASTIPDIGAIYVPVP
jgi:hypothetical protein